VEEEIPAGPNCFGPRILAEPIIEGFVLPRDTPKYDGTTKPKDWLLDYTTTVGISRGNKRWAVRYSPLMLIGSACTWLNNLPAGSINNWLDLKKPSSATLPAPTLAGSPPTVRNVQGRPGRDGPRIPDVLVRDAQLM
jgi:hypothetical protein